MASPAVSRPRRSDIPRWLISLGIIGGVLAILPIAAAIIMGPTSESVGGTAFASAPSGDYALLSRTEDDVDVLAVTRLGSDDAPIEIARVPHVPGFTANGAVSPDGAMAALIVADGGSPARPTASLVLVDLASGSQRPLVANIDYLQAPVWAPDGSSVAVVRSIASPTGTDVELVTAPASGSGEPAVTIIATGVLGAYPVGYDAQGRLVTVALRSGGSTATIAGSAPVHLSPFVTRDWALSPDGTELAFIETNLDNGVSYIPRVVSLTGGSRGVVAQSATLADGQALGAAWAPETAAPTFGNEPGAASTGTGVIAQSATAGFDVPLGYSNDGTGLAVEHWSGASFDAPGQPTLQLLSPDGRESYTGFSRFLGWVTR